MSPRRSGHTAVELVDLHRSFRRVIAVDGVTLDVPAGQVVAMLGPC